MSKVIGFPWKPWSKKQKKVLSWWMPESPYHKKDVIICDGAVRSGKTLSMSFSYVLWGMTNFNQQNLGFAGKTIESFRRNVWRDLKRVLVAEGFKIKERRTENLIIIQDGDVINHFYIFGGKDESSQDLIQGITLAGMLFDEVALQPESFVNQGVARCSVEGSRIWFNCNPEGPYHWFKQTWIDKLDDKNAIYLHWTMDDNLSLSERVKERYKRLFSGVFYQRFIFGLWVLAEGIIYSMFSKEKHIIEPKDLPQTFDYYIVCSDYGTGNPTVFLLIGVKGVNCYVVREYYFDSKKEGRQKTDLEYSQDLREFIKDKNVRYICIDPSAASFILQCKRDGIRRIKKANNSVLDGIRKVASFLAGGRLFISSVCEHLIKEFSTYIWDEKAQQWGEDKPIKEHDHCLDALRYGIFTVFRKTFNTVVNSRK